MYSFFLYKHSPEPSSECTHTSRMNRAIPTKRWFSCFVYADISSKIRWLLRRAQDCVYCFDRRDILLPTTFSAYICSNFLAILSSFALRFSKEVVTAPITDIHFSNKKATYWCINKKNPAQVLCIPKMIWWRQRHSVPKTLSLNTNQSLTNLLVRSSVPALNAFSSNPELDRNLSSAVFFLSFHSPRSTWKPLPLDMLEPTCSHTPWSWPSPLFIKGTVEIPSGDVVDINIKMPHTRSRQHVHRFYLCQVLLHDIQKRKRDWTQSQTATVCQCLLKQLPKCIDAKVQDFQPFHSPLLQVICKGLVLS